MTAETRDLAETADALQQEATALADELSDAADALRRHGAPVPAVLVERACAFAVALERALEGCEAVDGEPSVDALRRATSGAGRRALVQQVRALTATQAGYEAAIASLTTAADHVEQGLADAATVAALERVVAAVDGIEAVTATDLVPIQQQFEAAGLDGMVAVGLLARHLCDGGARPPSKNGAEAVPPSAAEASPETDTFPAGAHVSEPAQEAKASGAEPEPPLEPEPMATDLEAQTASKPELTTTETESATVSAMPVAGPTRSLAQCATELLTAVRDDDLSLAHWLARAIEKAGRRPPLPASALAAALVSGAMREPDDEASMVYDHCAHEAITGNLTDSAAITLHAAAALTAASISPYGRAPELLRDFAYGLEGPLGELCQLVGERAPRGELIQPARAAAATRAIAAHEEQLASIAEEARDRLSRARTEQHGFRPAGGVWRQLVFHGDIGRILEAVQQPDPSPATRAMVERCSDIGGLDKEIDAIFRERRSTKDRIEASAREWIWRNVNGAVALARRWLTATAQSPQSASSFATGDFEGLRSELQHRSASIVAALDAIESGDDEALRLAAARFRERWQLIEGQVVRGEIPTPDALTAADPRELVGAALVRARELPVRSDLTLDAEVLASAAEQLLVASTTSWEDAFHARLEQSAHHLTRVALTYVSAERREALEQERSEHLARARRTLRDHQEYARKRLDASLREQVLTDSDHAALLLRLQGVDLGSEDVAGQLRTIDDLIARIDEAQHARSEQLRAAVSTHALAEEERARIEAMLADGELAIVAEHLARRSAGESGDIALAVPAVGVDAFVHFLEQHEQDNLVELLHAGDAEPDPPIVRALSSLIGYRGAKRRLTPKSEAGNALRILSALGLEPSERPESARSASTYLTFTCRVQTRLCPVPEFGSRSNGRYRVVLLAGAADEREVIAHLKEINPHTGPPVLLLTGEPLSLKRRLALTQQAVRERLQFLLVDPLLLAFVLVGDGGGSRAERFYSATLPFCWTNPYVTHGAVPREVFRGRDGELQALLDPAGSAFIYGGRQLGKSALLMKAMADVNDSDDDSRAIYLDLDARRIGHSTSTDLVWSHIGAQLDETLHTRGAGRDEHTVRAFLRGWLARDDRRRMLILLDETDHFLESEAVGEDGRARMHNVLVMRDMMRETELRVRFVLAGLHSVQRFLHLPNQPLTQLGSPTPIGPLEWDHAKRLVEEPMHALGYRFEEHVVDRILTLTNRHPSLIQHVCRALVDHLAPKMRRTLPQPIRLRDLEEVYEDRNLRQEIRKRFDWTLNLDPRYRVLAYTLAHETLVHASAAADGMTPRELRDEAIYWWAEGFETSTRDEVTALCDEMVELHVFVQQDGRYRLWSPNVMQLLGTLREIEDVLLDDEGRDHPTTVNAGRDRRPASDESSDPARSPLTFAEEQRVLSPDGPPVRLLLGTTATQVGNAVEALQRAIDSPDWPLLAHRVYRRVPGVRDLHPVTDAHTIHLMPATSVEPAWLHRRMRELADALGDGDVAVIVLSNQMLEHWGDLLLALQLDPEMEGRYREVRLRRWDADSIRFWLDDVQLPVMTREERERVIDATGGWPLLLERFWRLAHEHERHLEATLAAIADDPTWGAPLVEALDLGRLKQLCLCVRTIAAIGSPIDPPTLADWSSLDEVEGEITAVEAQELVDTLVLADAAVPAPTRERPGSVALEPCLLRALTRDDA